MHINFPELDRESIKDPKKVQGFIKYWAKRYHYDEDESKYDNNVGIKELTSKQLIDLFEWKNGGPISKNKQESIKKNYMNIDCENITEDYLKSRFLNANKLGGAIWNIFYIHCRMPNKFPIFDQHTYRAMKFIYTQQIKEIPSTNKEKYKVYVDEYIPFCNALNFNKRDIDKALFTYGKYLKAIKEFLEPYK